MTPPIKIYISPNETVTGKERIAAMQPYLLRHVDEFEVHRDKERGSDLVFVSQSYTEELSPLGGVLRTKYHPKKYLAVELKMPLDYANSCQNGHMAKQRRECKYPLRVAVLGSMGDVMRALPEVTGKGWRNKRDRILAEKAVLRWTASLKASGVDVSFGLSVEDCRGKRIEYSHELYKEALKANMGQVLREAKAYLESDYHLPMPKCENTQEAMLMCLPGIGPKMAQAMIENGVTPTLFAGSDFETLADKLMEIPGIGKATTQKILGAIQ